MFVWEYMYVMFYWDINIKKMKKMKKVVLFLCSIAFLSSCNNDNKKIEETDDYSWLTRSMDIQAKEGTDAGRISLLNEGGNTLDVGIVITPEDNMTATGVTTLANNAVAVSYHDRNGGVKGKIEVYRPKGGVLSIGTTISFGARINNITSDGENKIFAAMDTNSGPAVVAFDVLNGSYFESQSLTYKLLPGESANGIAFVRTDAGDFLYTSTGGDGVYNVTTGAEEFNVFNFNGTKKITAKEYLENPGFQKSQVLGTEIVPLVSQGNANNRGKWVATNGTAVATMHFSRYLPNGIHSSVQYYPNGVDQFYQRSDFGKASALDANTSMVSKNVALLSEGVAENSKTLYLCLENKGFQSFALNTESCTPISTYDKPATAATFGTDGDIYLACGVAGVYRVKNDGGNFTADKMFKVEMSSGEEKPASANFIAVRGDNVYIAYGTKGLVVLNKNSELFTESK